MSPGQKRSKEAETGRNRASTSIRARIKSPTYTYTPYPAPKGPDPSRAFPPSNAAISFDMGMRPSAATLSSGHCMNSRVLGASSLGELDHFGLSSGISSPFCRSMQA